MQYDQIINQVDQIGRDLEIRVKDAEANIIEVYDTETATSVATRSLTPMEKPMFLVLSLFLRAFFMPKIGSTSLQIHWGQVTTETFRRYWT